jgi:hypothetical protein
MAARIDEFAFILLGGLVFIFLLMIMWSVPSEAPPVVQPTSVELAIRQGSTGSFDITFNDTFSAINLTAHGEINNWLSFERQDFDIVDSGSVGVTVKVPEDENEGFYTGRIRIESVGGESYVSVTVEVLEQTAEVISEPILPPLGDFTVSYSEGTEVLDSKSTATVSKGYFSQKSLNLAGIMTKDRLSIVTDAYIELEIEDTNMAGDLVVKVNGETVYKDVTAVGTLTIPVDKELLGTSNIVEIKAGTPGWMFWTNTVYRLSSSTFGINYMGIFSESFDFDLTSTQVTNFKSLGLNYRVQDYNLPLSELMIKVNGQLVLWQRPPLTIGDYVFTEDVFGNELILNRGNNTISFSFEKEAYYSVADAILTVNYYG